MEKEELIMQPILTVNGQKMIKYYRKIKLVGQGSYSKCWLVRTENSESTYVVKIIPKKKLELLVKEKVSLLTFRYKTQELGSKYARKLVYEIKIHQQLSHKNVVYLDHWFQDQQNQYIFMQYCSQGNLQKQVNKMKGPMNEQQIRRYIRQIIEAIKYIHSKNILHRDLKLCNFYLDQQRNVKLGDFGFACQLAHQGELKRQTCGTPNYIAPEAVSGFGYSFSSDVWAIGVILYRLKYKLCPFQAQTVRQTLERVKICQYSFPRGQKISAQLKDLISRILVINYDDRLTLDQMLTHQFFTQPFKSQRAKSQSKLNFLRNIFSKQKDNKQKSPKKISRLQSKQKQLLTKRSNSCQTLKHMKEIFKNKPTLITERTQENTTLYTQNGNTNRERSFLGITSIRSMNDSIGMAVINKKLENTSRINHLMGSMKYNLKEQQLKIQNQKGPKPPKPALKSNPQQQLDSFSRRYYLPCNINFERDVILVQYKASIWQILYKDLNIIMHRNKANLYNNMGEPISEVPKIVRYIIDKKIEIIQQEIEEEEYGYYTIEKILLHVAHKYIIAKDGIILFLNNLILCKLASQSLFYITQTDNQQDNQGIMYLKDKEGYIAQEGVVFARIYQGWINNTLKKQ